MKKIHIVIISILFIAVIFSSGAFAKTEMFPAKSFKELQKTVQSLGLKSLPQTLIVMDDDDTLTMMSCPNQNDAVTCQYLGGPAWYAWQNSLLGTESPFKVADNSGDLLDIAALLLAMNYMVYTENEIPTVLHSLTQAGVKLLVLTARGSSNLSATANQFSNLSVNLKESNQETFLGFISDNALNGKKSLKPSIASPFQPKDCEAIRPVSYQQGVMYVAGQNKGLMLKCLLNRTVSSNVKNIVFIDDTLENVVDVYTAFKDSTEYNVKAIHYTALQKHKAELTVGPNANTYQQNAKKRWDSIKASLEKQLQTPAALN